MQGLSGKGFSQTAVLKGGWISYLARFDDSIIASFSQKTKKVAQSIKVSVAIDACGKSEFPLPL